MSGTVFSIQPYSLHDGPGIRTVVFLKGCFLRCRWCSNPESQEFFPQVYLDSKKCIHKSGCSLCSDICRYNAVRDDVINHGYCINCGECVNSCPSGALGIYGRKMTVEEVLERVESESSFYARSNGGMTLSGGEPFAQGEFAIELLKSAKSRRINTAVETCGFADREVIRKSAEYLDYVMFDIKCMDSEKHIKHTGKSNELLLDNLEMLFADFPKLHKHIRTPVIPGFNDSEDDINAILKFLKGRDNYSYELLPYHRFGQVKYGLLGRQYPDIPERLDNRLFEKLKSLCK